MILKELWTTKKEDSSKNDKGISVPSHFKRYTIKERKVVVQQSIQMQQAPGESYDGQERSKKIDLAEPREESKPSWIALDLSQEEEELLIETLKEYRDVFSWSYKDLKGVDPTIGQHTISMKEDARPTKQRPYTYNDLVAKKNQRRDRQAKGS